MCNTHTLPFIDFFHISDGEMQKVLDLALSRGGDFSEIFCEYRMFSSILMEEDIIKETGESIGLGIGIRVISGDKTGYAYTNDLSPTKINNAAITAASIANGKISQKAVPMNFKTNAHDLYPVVQAGREALLAEKIALVKKAYVTAQRHDAAVQKVRVSFADLTRYITILNSEGLKVSDVQPMIKLVCLAVAERGESREAGFSGGGGRVGLEYFTGTLTPEEIGRDAAQEAVQLLDASPSPAGEMPVILSPGHSGVLVHEAVGHLIEADFMRKKTSIFWNKSGQKVARENVTIFDDPTIPHFRGSYNIDDEGTQPEKTLVIENGKLVGFLQDRLSSTLMKMSLTGHGRRQDFSCIPIPRMSNTYIAGGEYDREEIIRSVSRGFYADKFQGGQVEDSGKFTFSVSSGFLIEDGKLTTPVKQATLIGTNIDILKKIEKIGSDLKFGLQTGTCGKGGQGAPVTDGCPTIKISQMTVGGMK